MSFSFNDDLTNVALSVLTPDQAETAQFASTTDHAFIRLYTNNGNSNTPENLTTGYAIGTSNVDKSSLTGSNQFYIGHITGGSNIHRILRIENSNVGINVRPAAVAPQAALHIAQGTGSNLLLIDDTALVVRQGGYVGIGTTAIVGQTLTVKGAIYADSLVIGDGMSMNSQLITTYGLQPPAGCNQLVFAAADLSNINSITTPTVRATNYDQVFANIAAFAFLNSATLSVGTIPISGAVPFTTTFKGNSTKYTYQLQIFPSSPASLTPYASTATRTINNTATDSQTVSVTTAGTYRVAVFANTYAAGGTGEGSAYVNSNAAVFSVAGTDTIGAPTASYTYAATGPTALQFSGTGATNPVYVSGIPYYTTGTTITFPQNSLTFTNIYNTIDPRTVLTNVLTFRDATNSANATSFTYSTVFTNVLTAANTNTAGALALTLTSSSTSSLVTIGSTVFNVNFTSGVTSSSLTNAIAYIGSSINEPTLHMASYTGMPITSAYRQAIAEAAAFPLTPTPATELSTFSSTTISSHESFYSPYTNTFYSSFNAVPRGTYAPTFASPAGTHQYLCFRLVTNAPLGTFVLNFANSGTAITNVRVYWSNLSPTPAWYDAKVLYLSAGGCAAATYSTATRLPITLPSGTSLATYGDIYFSVEFTGSIPRSGISITNT